MSAKEEHRETQASVTPHTAAHPWVEVVQFLTPHIHHVPLVCSQQDMSTGHCDSRGDLGGAFSQPFTVRIHFHLAHKLLIKVPPHGDRDYGRHSLCLWSLMLAVVAT